LVCTQVPYEANVAFGDFGRGQRDVGLFTSLLLQGVSCRKARHAARQLPEAFLKISMLRRTRVTSCGEEDPLRGRLKGLKLKGVSEI